jgi:hypothetical protein
MTTPWEKRSSETRKAWAAFATYLELGANRTLKACAEAGGYSPTTVRKWSSAHDWDSRATAYDVAELQKSIEGREQVRERARQVMMDAAVDAAETLDSVRVGRLSMPECGPDCTEDKCVCGIWLPILDRHGRMVGRKPTIAASTRQAAALSILDRCGMTPPKRVELTGADGERLRMEARLALGSLSDDQLGVLAAAFAPTDDED